MVFPLGLGFLGFFCLGIEIFGVFPSGLGILGSGLLWGWVWERGLDWENWENWDWGVTGIGFSSLIPNWSYWDWVPRFPGTGILGNLPPIPRIPFPNPNPESQFQQDLGWESHPWIPHPGIPGMDLMVLIKPRINWGIRPHLGIPNSLFPVHKIGIFLHLHLGNEFKRKGNKGWDQWDLDLENSHFSPNPGSSQLEFWVFLGSFSTRDLFGISGSGNSMDSQGAEFPRGLGSVLGKGDLGFLGILGFLGFFGIFGNFWER